MSIQRINRGTGHSYKIDGKKAEGVTTLIKGGLPKEALQFWSAKMVAEYVADNRDRLRDVYDWMDREQLVLMLKQVPWSKRDAAAVRGTDVHAIAEKLLHGEEVDVPEHLAGYVQSAVEFLDEWKVIPVRSETVVASREHSYCGTFDFVGRIFDGRTVMGDYKTGGIWSEVILQQAAYRYAEVFLDENGDEQPMASLGIEGALAVQIRADGYDVYDLPSDEAAFQSFLHVAAVARWAKANKDIGDPCAKPQEAVA